MKLKKEYNISSSIYFEKAILMFIDELNNLPNEAKTKKNRRKKEMVKK